MLVLALLLPVFLFNVLSPMKAFASSSISLRKLLANQKVTPVNPGPDFSKAQVKLGKKLFFDRLLSGNKDISCAGCHHPAQGTSDGLSLSIGTKASGNHFSRMVGDDRQFIPRNAQDIWNRGSPEWRTLFWDMRVRKIPNSDLLLTPAGFELPEAVENLQAAQAMIPVTARDEMRGDRGDKTVKGEINQLARIPDGQFQRIWDQLWERLSSNRDYRRLFKKAYPDAPFESLSFAHAANAIAAYQIEAFTFLNSPWDKYLEGNNDALTEKQKQGARLFYGKGRCSECHAGSLMTDQKAHNIGVPQLGPGKTPDEPYDLGFYSQTGDTMDRFAFRTPPLRNVAVTGPWMHNGAYKTLRGAVEHHVNPRKSLRNYDPAQLKADLRKSLDGPVESSYLSRLPGGPGQLLIPTVLTSKQDQELILRTLDPTLRQVELTSREIDLVLRFLQSLTSPSVKSLNGNLSSELRQTIPDTVPSGLPVSGGR
ncbi:MAG: cytochrome-c peroxidase [bacterium]